MATVSFDILEAAHLDGFIGIKLSKNERLYLERSVITVNEIIAVVRQRKEATVEQIQQDLSMNKNTLNIYLRWLVKKNYLFSEKDQSSKIYWSPSHNNIRADNNIRDNR
jgi:predicted transcriptional regulator